MKEEEGGNDYRRIPFPDWSYWRKIPEPTLIECILLSIDAEPRAIQEWLLGDLEEELNERVEIAINHVRAGRLKAPIPHLSYQERRRLARDNYDLDPYEINRIDYFTSSDFDRTRQLLVQIDLVGFSRWAVSVGLKIPLEMEVIATGTLQEDVPAPPVPTDPPAPPKQNKTATAALYRAWHTRYIAIKKENSELKDSDICEQILKEHDEATKTDKTLKQVGLGTVEREVRRIKNQT